MNKSCTLCPQDKSPNKSLNKSPNESFISALPERLTNRATITFFARALFALNADVNRIIHQHARCLSNIFTLEYVDDIEINKFVEKQISNLNIKNIILDVIKEYLTHGEAFLCFELNESAKEWSKILIQNPDYVLVKHNFDNNIEYSLRPDADLRRRCLSKKSEETKSLDPEIVKLIRDGKNIPLNNFYFHHIADKKFPTDVRGTSSFVPLFDMIKSSLPEEEKRAIINQTLFDIISFTKNNVTKNILIQYYCSIIEPLEFFLNKKIIEPILKINGFSTSKYTKAKFDKTKLEKLLSE